MFCRASTKPFLERGFSQRQAELFARTSGASPFLSSRAFERLYAARRQARAGYHPGPAFFLVGLWQGLGFRGSGTWHCSISSPRAPCFLSRLSQDGKTFDPQNVRAARRSREPSRHAGGVMRRPMSEAASEAAGLPAQHSLWAPWELVVEVWRHLEAFEGVEGIWRHLEAEDLRQQSQRPSRASTAPRPACWQSL